MTANPTVLGVPLKWISLLLMVVQMVGMVFILRVSRTQPHEGPRYLNTTAIFLSELLKLISSLFLHLCSSTSVSTSLIELYARPMDLLKTSVPSLLYALQSNLLFIAISHLSAGTYQVTYQLKILTTAGLSFLVLGKRLNHEKWFALLLLTIGVALVNTSTSQVQKTSSTKSIGDSTVVGLLAVIGACFTSGAAGVFLEKLLKDTSSSIWVRNAQLAFFGCFFSFFIAFHSDGQLILESGFLQGYSPLVWVVVILQAIGGLVIAGVMKYADNVLKCFGCAVAIVLTSLLSAYTLKEFTPDRRFVIGTFLVLFSSVIYSLGLATLGTLMRKNVGTSCVIQANYSNA